jgi:ATP-dependent helicase HrpB
VGKKRHARAGSHAPKDETIVARLLLRAYPDRVARRREEGSGRFLLANGRGVTVGQASPLASAPFLVCARVDAGEGTEGRGHLAEAVSETMLRRDLANSIETTRRTVWDRREGRIVSMEEERLGALELATRPRILADGEAVPLLCKAIRRGEATLSFTGPVRQLQGRVRLLARHFPGEAWPDWRDEALLADPEGWLAPYLRYPAPRVTTAMDLLRPSARLSRRQHAVSTRRPTAIPSPVADRPIIAGDSCLAVKFRRVRLGDTPAVADGRIPVLLHLLSPARRPVQITRDLRGFWNSGYEEVKRELRGRYPKHPWPEDPWNAPPTSRTQPKRR